MKRILCLAFVLFSLCACRKEEEIDYISIITPTEDIIFPAEGGEKIIVVNASQMPSKSATGGVWLNLDIENKDNYSSYILTLTAKRNYTENDRTIEVKLKIDKLIKSFFVKQEAALRTTAQQLALDIADHGGYVVAGYNDTTEEVTVYFETYYGTSEMENPVIPGYEESHPEGFKSLTLSYENDALKTAKVSKTESGEELFTLSFLSGNEVIFPYKEYVEPPKPIYTTLKALNPEPEMYRPELTIKSRDTQYVLDYKSDFPVELLKVECSEDWAVASIIDRQVILEVELNDHPSLEDRKVDITISSLTEPYITTGWSLTQKPTVTSTPEGMVHFEDALFKKMVLDKYDLNLDRQLSYAEAEAIEHLDLSREGWIITDHNIRRDYDYIGIETLTGIESMKNLKSLNLLSHNFSKTWNSRGYIDLSSPHPYLTHVITGSQLRNYDADISGCASIVWLCYDGDLPEGDNRHDYPETTYARKKQIVVGHTIGVVYDREDLKDFNDMSRSGERRILQQHTKGEGIEVIVGITPLRDTDYDTDIPDMILPQVLDAMFAIEPMKSFKEYFDVIFEVYLDNDPTDGTWPESKTIQLMIEAGPGGGTPDIGGAASVGGDCWVAWGDYAVKDYGKDDFMRYLQHEWAGHVIGCLRDEATGGNAATYPHEMFENVSCTTDQEVIPWKRFLELPEYRKHVGIFPGGHYASSGAWKSCVAGIMNRSGIPYFNAVSRFGIFKQIYILSGLAKECPYFTQEEIDKGKYRETRKWYDERGWIVNQYNVERYEDWYFEKFLEYDKKNLEQWEQPDSFEPWIDNYWEYYETNNLAVYPYEQ